ncbi:hypothetical protein PAAG_11959 [Paracoccidioides lutzii Pb01]|uniref:Uncharacterized protein n=1 Tax=Paracoccidioides lutzii (strain ATCC MYA-826 / Pb01) TaxID=502779 RepID=A0A0A2V1J6_PARBA|nr:hypothetical protein PAAG_11959 [Paracoccidioides lutzii Pb01]KGQ01378.1 hypothetical protein PAAG_11959 [Paracoccidioides lutzii Pb01]
MPLSSSASWIQPATPGLLTWDFRPRRHHHHATTEILATYRRQTDNGFLDVQGTAKQWKTQSLDFKNVLLALTSAEVRADLVETGILDAGKRPPRLTQACPGHDRNTLNTVEVDLVTM